MLDTGPGTSYARGMEIHLTAEQEASLSRLAAQQGRDRGELVVEAVERLLGYDEWFSREVDKGFAAADRGEFIEHEDVRRMIDSRFPG